MADYDIAIVNLADAGPQDGFISNGFPKEIDGEIVSALLTAASRLIEAGGEVVVIGRPEVSYWAPGPFSRENRNWITYDAWTGMRLQWDEHAGDLLETAQDATEFLPYLSRIQRYSYSLAKVQGFEVYPAGPSGDPYGGLPEPIGFKDVRTRGLLRTRHGGFVASEHTVASPLEHPAHRPGRVVLLPPLPGGADHSVEVLLREVYRIPVASPSPPWLSAIEAPGEGPVNARIRDAQNDLAAVESRIAALEDERSSLRRCLGLLTQGDEALETEVREALRRLGAEVEEPVEKNKEDGWITVQIAGRTLRGVLEIKSTQGASFSEQGIRQLLDWQSRGRAQRGLDYKGLFIGNSAYGVPPIDRPDPFSASFRRSAADHDLVVLTTTTLLAELARVEAGKLTWDSLWEAVFSTGGVFDGVPAPPQDGPA